MMELWQWAILVIAYFVIAWPLFNLAKFWAEREEADPDGDPNVLILFCAVVVVVIFWLGWLLMDRFLEWANILPAQEGK